MDQEYNTPQDSGEITFAGIGRLIKRSALRVLIYVIIGALAASLVVVPLALFVKVDPAVTTRVEFVYSGIEKGLTPTGTEFDKNEIKNNDVLTAAVTRSGLEDRIKVVSHLRESVVVTDVATREYQELKDLAASGNADAKATLLSYKFYPTQFDVSIEDFKKLGLSKKEALSLLDNIVSAYKEYFVSRYSNRQAFSIQDFNLENDAEYVEYYGRYETYLVTVDNYVNSFENVDSQYVASNGKSFAALQDMYDTLSDELSAFYRFLFEHTVAKNMASAKSSLGNIVRSLDNKITVLEDELTEIDKKMDNYKPDRTETGGSGANNGTVIIEYGEGYVALTKQWVETRARLTAVKERQADYTDLQTAYATGTEPSADILARADEMIVQLRANYISYINAVNQTVTEYFAERYSADSVRTTQPPVYARGALDVPILYIYAAVAVIAIAAGMIVTHVKGKALELKRKQPAEPVSEEPSET